MRFVPPLEDQPGQEAFTDTARQREVRRQLAAGAKESSQTAAFIAGLQQLVKLITDIPKALLQTPQGAGAAAILIGATMKQLGIGVLKKEWRFKASLRNTPSGIKLIQEAGSEDAACLRISEGRRNQTCEEFVVSDPLVIDVFPFEIIGVIKEDFGKMSVPDMLMTGGFMALTGDFWKGIGEIVPG